MAAAGRDGQPDAEGCQRQDLNVSNLVGWASESVPTKCSTTQRGRHGAKSAFAHVTIETESRRRGVMGPGDRRDDYVERSFRMVIIRAANTTQDMEQCFRIREEVFIVEQSVPVDIERDEYDSKALHFIALADGRPVGTARAVLKDNGTSAKIGRVAVCRSNRGFGIGKLLIAAIEETPDLTHVLNFFLDAQTHALQFYARLGYEAYGEEFMDAGISHRHMKKGSRSSVAHD
jgi:predicted GNAT family N-acyltransferase